MVVGAVAHEIAARIAEIGIFREPRRPREIERIRRGEAEQVAVELAALGKLLDIEAEMTEPPNLERLRQVNAANIVASVDR